MGERLNWDVPCEYAKQWNPLVTCGQPSHYAYRTMGGGWQMCCSQHGAKHVAYSVCRDGTHGAWCDADGRPVDTKPAPPAEGGE